ncbi:SHOCT domain-containing protein [Mycobacterium montefiorense]|uniref:SHOCT domain-containing protein n=1 Tax=Mycobacterium montefiorense TaxID=154654 RepID=UPI0021F26157|nr:SHOCT domain-containing protein [Mycobacterium montefiorense]MCV7425250.1 SHOCT domain-containing protein [Mycobacterium montefiorense]
MRSRRVAKISLAAAIATIIVSIGGFIVTLVLNAFFLDKYNAYGEVPIPGSGSVYLPAGEVTVSLHAVVIGGPNGGGLPVPPLGVTISPPDGMAQPSMTENIGSTTTVNNDAHVRVWVAQIPAAGTYNITTDGQVNGFIAPRLAFGHSSSYGFLVWVFVAMFVAGLVDSIVSGLWLSRTRRRAAAVVVQASQLSGPTEWPVVPVSAPMVPPAVAYEPTDEGVRLERLKTLAALRDSGGLTEEEFQTEKQRILEGH